jgi:3-deoxy-D-manno-octulosonic-acid transferase
VTSADPTGPRGAQLRAYLLASRAIPVFAPGVLRRRLDRGKEDPDRFREKLGEPGLPRPDGPLIWLHAVGLGEVMALRGLIAAMIAQSETASSVASFLVTSTTRASATLLAANLPPRTRHQFLPLDAPEYLHRFLDHWKPDLSVWAEQDLWPGAVVAAADRGIPLALVNARMNRAAYNRRKRLRGLFGDLFARFRLITAQDSATASHLAALGARDVAITGSLKAAAPPLSVDPDRLARLVTALSSRKPWVAASTHAQDEAVVLAAQATLHAADPRWLLILVPRLADRRDAILANVPKALSVTVGSRGEAPTAAVHLADAVGELGLWYRLAPLAVMGGTFGPVEGHNPWEPAALGATILHGPRTANFAPDYAAMDQAGAALAVSPDGLALALQAVDAGAMGARARAMVDAARGSLDPLAARLLWLAGVK